MSSQAFYMFMAQYAEGWRKPAKTAAVDIRTITIDVAGRLAELVVMRYPSLRYGDAMIWAKWSTVVGV